MAKPLATLDESDADGPRAVAQAAFFTGKNCFYYFLSLCVVAESVAQL